MTAAMQSAPRNDRIYFCAPVNALVEGIYQQKIPLAEIKQHGDFGLGTFDHLDGEMVMLDNEIYQITSDGKAAQVSDDALTPFSCVAFYRPVSHDRLEKACNYPAFLDWLNSLLPSPNIFYAIRVDGRFSRIRVRSVPRQENYRPLAEVAKDQPVFEYTDTEGSLVGFYTPPFMGSLSVPGMHLHFLSADRKSGGHLLECCPDGITAGIQFLTTLELGLPMSFDYLTCDFQRDTEKDLESAER
ncbi:acetolactate decarboxylase [Desulfobotulus alkaliphilus]|uniref:Alpha-acetolactate decarboxylase n=1 Tax=Desulfobotulus alkaliphilus TaxID=622671 RepID=A0A562RY52_9BACT|nr:acetolactate decarboxylase [Desulfobotulus alkaliphilus]TWI73979.1 acetolactate decarboxylase [Desulfobotulus alkaliphilus]